MAESFASQSRNHFDEADAGRVEGDVERLCEGKGYSVSRGCHERADGHSAKPDSARIDSAARKEVSTGGAAGDLASDGCARGGGGMPGTMFEGGGSQV